MKGEPSPSLLYSEEIFVPGNLAHPVFLQPHSVAFRSENTDEPFVPIRIIGLGGGIDLLVEDPGQSFVVRCKEPLALDPPGPPSCVIQDKDAPAAIVPADRRPGQVDGTVPLPVIEAEERAGLGTLGKDPPVSEECNLVLVNGNEGNFPGILVSHHEAAVPKLLPDGMDKAEVAATFPALAALKGHDENLDGFRNFSPQYAMNPAYTDISLNSSPWKAVSFLHPGNSSRDRQSALPCSGSGEISRARDKG